MSDFLKVYGNCTGPFGFPMQEEDARELDQLIEKHSKDSAFEYRRIVKNDGLESIVLKEKSDVSVVTTSQVDRDREIIKSEGVDWVSFRKNPVVSFQHKFNEPPVGRSLWQKQVNDGWKAKTQYLDRPEDYPTEKEWLPSTVWHFVKNGVMTGKSVGFLPVKWHEPTKEEKHLNASLIFDQIKIFEYSVVTIPANENAITEEINKGLDFQYKHFADLLGIKIKEVNTKEDIVIKGLSIEDYRKIINNKLGAEFMELQKSLPQKIDNVIARVLGKV